MGVDASGLYEPRTETVSLYPLKLDLREARVTVARLAEVFELRVESIEERPRWVSTELRVTLTGDPFQIVSFRQATSGSRERDAADGWIDAGVRVLIGLAVAAAEKLSW